MRVGDYDFEKKKHLKKLNWESIKQSESVYKRDNTFLILTISAKFRQRTSSISSLAILDTTTHEFKNFESKINIKQFASNERFCFRPLREKIALNFMNLFLKVLKTLKSPAEKL